MKTVNPKAKTGKAVDDGRMAPSTAHTTTKVAARTMHKDAGADVRKVSDNLKSGVHKAVPDDTKIAVNKAGSPMKMK